MESNDPLSAFKLPPSKSDDYIYNSEIFALVNPISLASVIAYLIPIKTSSFLYHINLRYLYNSKNDINPTVLYLHGHGSCCTWATWLKLAFLLYEQGYNGILMDLPGYGKSTIEGETRINPKLYLTDASNMLINLNKIIFGEEKNNKVKKFIGIGFCGGAANFIRTITEYPNYFAKRHIFHNSVIGQIPEGFEKTLEKFHVKVWVSWCEDIDHSKGCVAYKFLNKKRKEGNKHIFLQDIDDSELSSNGMWSRNMGRKTSNVMIFDPSEGYFEFVKQFLKENSEKLPVFKTMKKKEEDLLEKIKSLSLKEDLDDDLEFALALSLKEN